MSGVAAALAPRTIIVLAEPGPGRRRAWLRPGPSRISGHGALPGAGFGLEGLPRLPPCSKEDAPGTSDLGCGRANASAADLPLLGYGLLWWPRRSSEWTPGGVPDGYSLSACFLHRLCSSRPATSAATASPPRGILRQSSSRC
ncbi:unnamed protein product [Symbiodinium necroappetens]|uniref:Uncharacterized protein n=1 Tax=Symbiodinium necroappetens TaxID=1628268 RepID=A0A812WBY3_9DINO|nr:unnamed protein product [Symbiodinium necroappetens]